MKQLIKDTEIAASKLFQGLSSRAWYVKLGKHSWRCFIINTDNKTKMVVGPLKTTAISAITVVKNQLEELVGKDINCVT
jgi:hypothetical protein